MFPNRPSVDRLSHANYSTPYGYKANSEPILETLIHDSPYAAADYAQTGFPRAFVPVAAMHKSVSGLLSCLHSTRVKRTLHANNVQCDAKLWGGCGNANTQTNTGTMSYYAAQPHFCHPRGGGGPGRARVQGLLHLRLSFALCLRSFEPQEGSYDILHRKRQSRPGKFVRFDFAMRRQAVQQTVHARGWQETCTLPGFPPSRE